MRHVEDHDPHDPGCDACEQGWPCDTVTVLGEYLALGAYAELQRERIEGLEAVYEAARSIRTAEQLIADSRTNPDRYLLLTEQLVAAGRRLRGALAAIDEEDLPEPPDEHIGQTMTVPLK